MPAGSAETIEFAAERRIPIARVWSPTAVFQDAFEYYKEVAQDRYSWVAGPEHCIGSRYIHIAETTEQAIAECRNAVMYCAVSPPSAAQYRCQPRCQGIQTDRSFE